MQKKDITVRFCDWAPNERFEFFVKYSTETGWMYGIVIADGVSSHYLGGGANPDVSIQLEQELQHSITILPGGLLRQ